MCVNTAGSRICATCEAAHASDLCAATSDDEEGPKQACQAIPALCFYDTNSTLCYQRSLNCSLRCEAECTAAELEGLACSWNTTSGLCFNVSDSALQVESASSTGLEVPLQTSGALSSVTAKATLGISAGIVSVALIAAAIGGGVGGGVGGGAVGASAGGAASAAGGSGAGGGGGAGGSVATAGIGSGFYHSVPVGDEAEEDVALASEEEDGGSSDPDS